MRDMIRTLHPEKKQGVNISKEKYEIIRKAILSTLKKQKEMTFMNLSRAVEKEVNGTFDGSVTLVCHNGQAGPGSAWRDQARSKFKTAACEAGIDR